MAARRKEQPENSSSRRRPATTPEQRENQLIALAVDLAERQLADGSASAQVISHYLKLGSSRERLEQERISRENKLLEAKALQIESQARIEDLYKDAIKVMRSYSGQDVSEELDDEY